MSDVSSNHLTIKTSLVDIESIELYDESVFLSFHLSEICYIELI